MAESNPGDTTLIPMGLVATLASTCCFNPFSLLGLGYSGALTERGLTLSRDGGTEPVAPLAHTRAGVELPPRIAA